MKIDRMFGITIYLLNRDTVTARELAEKFEVSIRTIVRDIEALNLSGIPINSLTGTNGGYEILDSFNLNKQITNADDYLFMITALKGLCSAYDNKKLDLTLEKLLAAGFKKARDQKVFLDFGVLKEGKNISEYITLLENSIINRKMIEFEYTNADNKTNQKIVEPLALTYKWYAWYLFGYCTYKKDYRIFKLIRINNLSEKEIVFNTVHDNIDLLLERQFSSDQSVYLDVKIFCKNEVKTLALEYLSSKIEKEYENGDVLLSMHVPENERMWFSLLLSFGDKVEVLEPPELKYRLLQKAEEIFKLYKS
jgi:predicted DNA-binding transcriptional regulator YafY